MLGVKVSIKENVFSVYLNGRFDGLGAREFDREVETCFSEEGAGAGGETGEQRWIIDFREVAYLSSAGIRSLIKLAKDLRQQKGEIILAGLTSHVKSVLELSGLLALFRFTSSPEEALAIIRQEKASEVTMRKAVICGKDCSFRIIADQEITLDIWGNNDCLFGCSHSSELKSGLQPENLDALSLNELELAFGVGSLGSVRVDNLESLGLFLSLNGVSGVLPADGYNHPDLMLPGSSGDTMMYVADAVGFSGPSWGKMDLDGGSPVRLNELGRGITHLIQEIREESLPLAGTVILAHGQKGSGGCYQTLDDLNGGKMTRRELPDEYTILIIGLYGNSVWKGDALLSPFLNRRGINAGDEFFLGNAFVFSGHVDWEKIREPGEATELFSGLDLFQDVVAVDGNTEIYDGRIWFYIPQVICSGKEKMLKIEVIGDDYFPKEWEIITRRLYADADRVVMEPLKGGFSPAKPFRVTSYDKNSRRMLPTVLKVGPTGKIDEEITAYRNYVENYILNNSTTIMGIGSFGEAKGIRYNFVGISGPDSDITWLTNHYRQRPADELIPLFDRIFTNVLKPWYGQPRWEAVRLFDGHNPVILFPDLYQDAEEFLGISSNEETIPCPELGIELPNPFYFLKHDCQERKNESRLWYTAINHGDLNMQNILLDERENIYIIDYPETKVRNIVSDFGRLEPIFKIEMTRLENEKDLKELLEFERGLTSVNSMTEELPFKYKGDDPQVEKAYRMICRIREYAKKVIIFETDITPYILALLEWTSPVVCYKGANPFVKKMSVYSAALMVEQFKRIEKNKK